MTELAKTLEEQIATSLWTVGNFLTWLSKDIMLKLTPRPRVSETSIPHLLFPDFKPTVNWAKQQNQTQEMVTTNLQHRSENAATLKHTWMRLITSARARFTIRRRLTSRGRLSDPRQGHLLHPSLPNNLSCSDELSSNFLNI